MNDRSYIKQPFPKVLADELRRALICAEIVIPDPEERGEMLARYRRNQKRGGPAAGLPEQIPSEYDDVLRDLDRAFENLRRYSRHPEYYVSKKVKDLVQSASQSEIARKRRPGKGGATHEEIAARLKARGIEHAEHDRSRIVADVAINLGVSARTVYRVIKEKGLGKK